jgi:hypothetical protein
MSWSTPPETQQQPIHVHVEAPVAAAPAKQGTNGMAVASFVLSILWLGGIGAVLAVIFAAIGKKQIGRTGQGGNGLAIAGLVIGIVGVVGAILFWVLIAAAANTTCYWNAAGNYICS